MRITETLLDPDQSGPWANIAKRCARRYTQTTGRPFDGELLTHAAHMGRQSVAAADPVAWGFARKVVAKIRATCSVCGSKARQRRSGYRSVFLCASCQLPYSYQNQLNSLLRAQDESSGVARSVLGQHQLPPLVRQVIPAHMWRAMVLPDGSTLQFLTDRDLERITTWLLRLALVLERASGARALARIQAAGVTALQGFEEEEPA
jgi:hypothetical protein